MGRLNASRVTSQSFAPPVPTKVEPSVRRIPMTSKFPGQCHECGVRFDAGAYIYYLPGIRRASHRVCPITDGLLASQPPVEEKPPSRWRGNPPMNMAALVARAITYRGKALLPVRDEYHERPWE